MVTDTSAQIKSYLQWLQEDTPTTWWHDSADPAELERGLQHKATGVTTNPILAATALSDKPAFWAERIGTIPNNLSADEYAETLMKPMIQNAARMFEPQFNATQGELGYVCAQVSPALAADRKAMIETARRFNQWAPNIAVKFPATAAGLDALEECIAEGITITSTVNFTVPQVLATAEKHRKGAERAKKAGKKSGRCFAVIMIGRLDDYLRDVACDNPIEVSESDIQQAGLAVTKRAYAMFQAAGYEATLLVAALRGNYHMEELAGAKLIMSIHPKIQDMLLEPGVTRELRINKPVADDVIARLQSMTEFVKAYEPDIMQPEDFIYYGVVQRTLTQFILSGWASLQRMNI